MMEAQALSNASRRLAQLLAEAVADAEYHKLRAEALEQALAALTDEEGEDASAAT